MLRNALLYFVAGFMPVRLILVGGRPYMERYFVARIFGASIYLHRYLDPDGERHLHDHPFAWSWGMPLVGGYIEDRIDKTDIQHIQEFDISIQEIGLFQVNRIYPDDFHRIALVKPKTWTLFAHGERVKRWGFLSLSGRIATYRLAPESDPDWHKKAEIGRKSGRVKLSIGATK